MKAMKFFFTTMLVVVMSIMTYAQDNGVMGFQEIVRKYKMATPEMKLLMDSLYSKMQDDYRAMQVKSVCGVAFGTNRENAFSFLKNKYGNPSNLSTNNMIVFDNIKYGGIDFDSVIFMFQSDGKNSYLNTCIFVKRAKTKTKAEQIMDLYFTSLSKKYYLSSTSDKNGFRCYGGGVSPLWDGHWSTLFEGKEGGNFLTAVYTDVIEYDKEIANINGYLYGVRIIYGPYEYVVEEF